MLRILPVFLLFQSMAVGSMAQQRLHDATLTYKILSENPSDTGFQLQQYIIYLKGGLSRMDVFSDLGRSSSVYDGKTSTGFSLRDYEGQKLMITYAEGQREEGTDFYKKMQFRIVDSLQPLREYRCKKAVSLPGANPSRSYTVLFDPSIQLPNEDYGFSFKNIEGLPVRIDVKDGEALYHFDLVSLNIDPVPLSVFEMPRKGYRVISYEEMKLMQEEQ